MEKFMLIFQGGMDANASPADMEASMGKWMAWIEKLNKEGRYISGEPLLPGGKLVSSPSSVTDGPYTEGKEVVGGYFVITAADINEAIAECKHYPGFDVGGTVQVRQVMKLDM